MRLACIRSAETLGSGTRPKRRKVAGGQTRQRAAFWSENWKRTCEKARCNWKDNIETGLMETDYETMH